VAKSDYAANSGASRQWDTFDGWFEPTSYAVAATGTWTITSWCQSNPTAGVLNQNFQHCQTGVMYYRSEVKPSKITDGTSSTYLVGEKYLFPDAYEGIPAASGQPGYTLGENQGIYSGMEWDNHRVAFMPPGTGYPPSGGSTSNVREYYQPRQDTLGYDNVAAFGSAHSGGFNMAMCDGSVQTVSYDIDSDTHRFLAVRFDGEVIKKDGAF
jgi:prepilin-type processing-associated H-X9-DG protein